MTGETVSRGHRHGWTGGLAAAALLVLVAVLAVSSGDDEVMLSALVGAPAVALLGAALGVVLARRHPVARAVALGLVWGAPVSSVITIAGLLSS